VTTYPATCHDSAAADSLTDDLCVLDGITYTCDGRTVTVTAPDDDPVGRQLEADSRVESVSPA
jgi:hypothetical protein